MRRHRIFVVDDERVIADTLCAILRYSGYDAVAFYDAEATLAACENDTPDVIVSDVSMPEMSGVEMAVQLKQRFPGCEILLFSGDAKSSGVLEAAHRKGYEFELLEKPIHPRDLLAKIEGAVLHRAEPDARLSHSNVIREFVRLQ